MCLFISYDHILYMFTYMYMKTCLLIDVVNSKTEFLILEFKGP